MTLPTNKHNQRRPSRTPSLRPARGINGAARAKKGSRHRTQRQPQHRSHINIVLGILVGLTLLGVFALAQQCSGTVGTTSASSSYTSPYNWAGLTRENDRLTYSENGTVKSQVGVDVSDYQGAIDWQAVANDGISFAFVRAGSRGYTEGGLIPDARFIENVDGATSAGLDTGAYFFSQAISVEEAREEADLVIELLAGRTLSLPIVFDHEPVFATNSRATNLDTQTITACAIAFGERVKSAGYTSMIYGNSGDMARYDRSALGTTPVWFAEYDAATPSAQFDFAIWQYTNAGTVAGINAAVDLNLRMIDAI